VGNFWTCYLNHFQQARTLHNSPSSALSVRNILSGLDDAMDTFHNGNLACASLELVLNGNSLRHSAHRQIWNVPWAYDGRKVLYHFVHFEMCAGTAFDLFFHSYNIGYTGQIKCTEMSRHFKVEIFQSRADDNGRCRQFKVGEQRSRRAMVARLVAKSK